MKKNEFIIIGKIGSTYGVHGWLKIHSYTELPLDILTYSTWYLARDHQLRQAYKLEDGRAHGKGIIAKLTGICSPEEGRLWTGATIAIKRIQLPCLKQNEYYWSDLIGLTVINKDGACLGKVKDVMATGANDVLVVQGKTEFAIPYLLEKVILSINLAKQEIHVDWELL